MESLIPRLHDDIHIVHDEVSVRRARKIFEYFKPNEKGLLGLEQLKPELEDTFGKCYPESINNDVLKALGAGGDGAITFKKFYENVNNCVPDIGKLIAYRHIYKGDQFLLLTKPILEEDWVKMENKFCKVWTEGKSRPNYTFCIDKTPGEEKAMRSHARDVFNTFGISQIGKISLQSVFDQVKLMFKEEPPQVIFSLIKQGFNAGGTDEISFEQFFAALRSELPNVARFACLYKLFPDNPLELLLRPITMADWMKMPFINDECFERIKQFKRVEFLDILKRLGFMTEEPSKDGRGDTNDSNIISKTKAIICDGLKGAWSIEGKQSSEIK